MSTNTLTLCRRCGHREYDHITEDGTCWKCSCKAFDPIETDADQPRSGRPVQTRLVDPPEYTAYKEVRRGLGI